MIDNEYLIVLFKNKVRKKIVKTFKTSKRCLVFYNKLVSENNNVIFYRTHENGFECKYEIAILEKSKGTLFSTYSMDEYGRNIKIDLEEEDYNVIKLDIFNLPEKIYDCQKKKRIDVSVLVKHYLDKSGIKMISKLNNRIIVQRDTDFKLFSLKTIEDADVFIDSLSSFFIRTGRKDCIFVKDVSTSQRKYLYELLVEAGYSKDFLYRQVTTYGVKK